MTEKRANIFLTIGGCMWGVYWIPLLHLEELGLNGAASGTALYSVSLLLLLPVIWRYRSIFISQWRAFLFSGIMAGGAFSLYSTSLAYTDVIRCILLFYLTPVWGTIIGILVLGEKLTLSRIAVIIIAFLGLFAVLGSGASLPIPRNLGDVLALLSGILWAVGTLGLMQSKNVPAMPQIIAFLAGSLIISLISIWLIGDMPDWQRTGENSYYMLGFLLIFACLAIPMFWLTIAPAQVLTPARVGILLMSEVVIGALSAALLSGQEFGMAEFIGTILIITAALIEVFSQNPPLSSLENEEKRPL